jgi:hypothetical protein
VAAPAVAVAFVSIMGADACDGRHSLPGVYALDGFALATKSRGWTFGKTCDDAFDNYGKTIGKLNLRFQSPFPPAAKNTDNFELSIKEESQKNNEQTQTTRPQDKQGKGT